MRKGSQYDTIPTYREWITIKYTLNATMGYLLSFYIFKGEWIRQNYIKQCKAKTCIMLQTNALMTFFLFKKFMSLFKRLDLNEIFQLY